MTTALYIGRFQPFHKGHLSAIRYIEKKADKIIIGIAVHNPDKNNPYSAQERTRMLRDCGIRHRIALIKDTESDKKWADMIIRKFKPDIIFSNNPWTKDCFRGKNVKVIRIPVKHSISATKIRELMKKGRGWKKHIPEPVAGIIEKHVQNKANS